MHELSIAISLLDLAQEEAQRRGALGVEAIHLKLGPLSGVAKSALLSAYELAREASPFASCQLLITEIPITAHCPACHADRPVVSLQDLRCIVCHTLTPDIRTGCELEVTALEITS